MKLNKRYLKIKINNVFDGNKAVYFGYGASLRLRHVQNNCM